MNEKYLRIIFERFLKLYCNLFHETTQVCVFCLLYNKKCPQMILKSSNDITHIKMWAVYTNPKSKSKETKIKLLSDFLWYYFHPNYEDIYSKNIINGHVQK